MTSLSSTLQSFDAALEKESDPAVALQQAMHLVRSLCKAEHAWILCPCVSGVSCCILLYIESHRITAVRRPGELLPLSDEISQLQARAVAAGQPVVADQAVVNQILYPENTEAAGDLQSLAITLSEGSSEPLLLGISRESIPFNDEEQALLGNLAGRLAVLSGNTDRIRQQAVCTVAGQPVPDSLRFGDLFYHSSLPLWYLDITLLRKECQKLRQQELVDLDAFFSAELELRNQFIRLIRIKAANQATLDLFEAENRSQLLHHFFRFIPMESRRFVRAMIDALMADQRHVAMEAAVRTRKGVPRALLVTVDILPFSDFGEALVSVVDITDQKREEHQLSESLEKYRLLMDTANDAIVIADADSGIIYEVNRKAVELFGHPEEELIGSQLESLLVSGEKHAFHEYYRQLLQGEPAAAPLDTFIVQAGKTEADRVPVSLGISVARVAGRESVQVSFHDMSNRYRLEERRRLLATAVDQSAESVVITDPQGQIEYVNPSFEEVSGYSFTEVIGKNPRILRSEFTNPMRYSHLWKEITAGRVWRGNFTNRRKDGTLFEEEATITPVRDRSGQIKHFVAVKRDITQQRQLENQVRQSQKMQAIGTLAGGVAHDFNNILTAILGYAELSLDRCGGDALLKGNLSEIITAADRASKLIDQILTFSRQTEKSVSSLQLNLVIKEVLNLLRASLPANVEIVHDLVNAVKVRADPTQIHQVILNLCTNAYQALTNRENGHIRVLLDTVTLGAKQGIAIGNLGPGNYARITVEDNGCGMPAEFLPRIFEPYFSTKDKQEGTGLGLSVVHGIVNDHGGAVSVESEPGKGSCFYVYLPAVEEDVVPTHVPPEEIPRGNGRIMIVDDEKPITDYMSKVLTHVGYQVRAFVSSIDALKEFLSGDSVYDLIISDVGMPDLTGLQLFREIRSLAPTIPFIVCTGYSSEVTPETFEELGLAGYIPKPFTAERLAREVHRILNRQDPRQNASSPHPEEAPKP